MRIRRYSRLFSQHTVYTNYIYVVYLG